MTEETEFYCPKKVLGCGTICENGYPFLKDYPKLGDYSKLEFKTHTIPCRAWQKACKDCHTDCQYYVDDDPDDCIAKKGYCKIIERMSGGFEEY